MLKLLKKLAKFFRSRQKFLLVGLVLVGFLTLSVGPVLAAAGESAPPTQRPDDHDQALGKFLTLVVRVVGGIAGIFLWVEGQIISLLIWVLLFFAQYNDFITSRAVSLGWQIVRDVANMGFVLILLLIAIATILQVETYNYKKLLPKLLILAVLINFSKLISGVIIDFSQVIMLTFVYSFAGTAGSGNFITALGLDKALQISAANLEAQIGTGTALLYIVGSYIFLVFLCAVFIMVLLVMLAVFVMRIVMLWLLVVLSPMAYILAAFPQGQKYAAQWWSEFSKYVIIGPVLGFFLWLSLAVALSGTAALSSQPASSPFSTTAGADGATPAGQSQTNLLSQITETSNFANLVIALALLIGSLTMTSQLGVAGGSFAGQMAGRIQQTGLKGLMAPVKAAGAGLSWLERKSYAGEIPGIGRFTKGWGLNPMRWYRGYQVFSERRRREMEAAGLGAVTAKFRKDMEGGRLARLRGIFRLATGSPEDFLKYYTGLRGVRGFYEAMRYSPAERRRREVAKAAEEESLKNQEQLLAVQPLEEYGKEYLKQQTVAQLYEKRARNENIEIINKEGNIQTIGGPEIDKILSDVTEQQLKEMGLSHLVNKLGAGKKGLTPNTTESGEFMRAFYNQQGELLFKRGRYYDILGKTGEVSADILRQTGEKYFDEEKNKIDVEIQRVEAGGINNQQLDQRQRELTEVNRQMLKVLKEIETRADKKATSNEEVSLNELRTKGLALGGQVQRFQNRPEDRWGYFGKSATDENVQNLSPRINQLQRTEAETKEIKESGFLKIQKEVSIRLDKARGLAATPTDKRRESQAKIAKEIMAKRAEMRRLREKEEFVTPTPYYALETYRKLEREEMAKLPDTMEWTEIDALLRTAMKEKDTTRVTTLLKKAAMDYNDNEFLEAWGYGADYEGMKKFGEEVLVKKLGMGRQQMLQTMLEIGYINEAHNHFETSRLVGVKNGILDWRSEAEHAAAVTNENLKKNSRAFLQQTNRLGYGGEQADGSYKISPSGLLTLAGFGAEFGNRLKRDEFNASALGKIASDMEGLKKLIQLGVSAEDIELLKAKAVAQKVPPIWSELMKRARQLGV